MTQPGGVWWAGLTAIICRAGTVMRACHGRKVARLSCIGDQISWPIDMLVKDDVYVADVYG